MSDQALRSQMIRLAASMPKGSQERKALLDVLAAPRFSPGDKVRVKGSHGTREFRGQRGVVEKHVPFNKFYVDLEKSGRTLVDQTDLEPVGGRTAARGSAKQELDRASAALNRLGSAVSDHLETLRGPGEVPREFRREYAQLQKAKDQVNRALVIVYGIKLP